MHFFIALIYFIFLKVSVKNAKESRSLLQLKIPLNFACKTARSNYVSVCLTTFTLYYKITCMVTGCRLEMLPVCCVC